MPDAYGNVPVFIFYCSILSIIIIIIVIVIIINHFFFVGIIHPFKILQIVFRLVKLIKANYKPSKMKDLKYTFQQSFKLHNYWGKNTCPQTHIFACTHKHMYAYTHMQAYTHAHIDIIIYTQAYPCTHRLTKIYFN